MAIKIKLQETGIPVEFMKKGTDEVAANFVFGTDDENLDKFFKSYQSLSDKLKRLSKEAKSGGTDGAFIESSKVVLREGFDLMLGDGAFEEIYELNPSVLFLMQYLVALMEGLTEEIKKIKSKSSIDKYLDK